MRAHLAPIAGAQPPLDSPRLSREEGQYRGDGDSAIPFCIYGAGHIIQRSRV